METEIFATHLALAGVLFLVLNWIGRHAETSGYLTLSMFLRRDEAPAFNLLFRIFGPIAYVVVVASILYVLGLDQYVRHIWLVVLYYFAGRLLFNLCYGRLLLINWPREVLLWGMSIGFTWLLYDQVIQERKNLLPDVAHINNHLWVLVALFIYSTLNNVRFNQEATKRRKNRYLYVAFSDNKLQYQDLIAAIAPDRLAESIIYSVLIYESFNRPPVARTLERLVFPWFSKSLGPMQVATERRISDEESVKLGAAKLANAYQKALSAGVEKATEKKVVFDPGKNHYHRLFVVSRVAAAYNKDDGYVSEVRELQQAIAREFYPELSPPPPPRFSDQYIHFI
jgi:hypothetical protein